MIILIKSLIVSDSRSFVESLINQDIDVSINGIANSETSATQILDRKSLDIIFLDKGLVSNFSDAFLDEYNDKIIVISQKDLININKILTPLCVKFAAENKKEQIRTELKYLGYSFKYSGSQYLTDAILQVYLNQDIISDNLQGCVYPIVSKIYSKSVQNIKNSILKATDHMYYDCDINRLKTYFGFNEDTRPSIKEVIFAVLSKVS